MDSRIDSIAAHNATRLNISKWDNLHVYIVAYMYGKKGLLFILVGTKCCQSSFQNA